MNIDDDDATAQAVAAIEQKLMGFSSPMLGTTPLSQQSSFPQGYNNRSNNDRNNDSSSYYQMDAVQWMQQELKDGGEDEPPLPVKTPKRTPLMQRAGTPVMSNSSSSKSDKALASKLYAGSGQKQQQKRSSNYGLADDDDEDTMSQEESEPMPMQTPLQRKFKTISSSTTTPFVSQMSPGTKRSSSQGITSATSASLKQSVFRRHHDALWEYLLAKRSLHTRMELERQERELDQDAGNGIIVPMDAIMDDEAAAATTSSSLSLSRQECKAEVDYCKTLCQIGYGVSSIEDSSSSSSEKYKGPTEEGHFWGLLATLRKLNLSALIWDDDFTSVTQNSSTQSFFLQQLTSNIHLTPKELIETLTSSPNQESPAPPLVLQRKQQLLKWIQSCLELESKDIKAKGMGTRTISTPSHPDDPMIPSIVPEMDAKILKTMMQVCLALVLEGRTSEALEIARSRGQSWRAATWMGGEPSGYKAVFQDDTKSVEQVPVGNPNRFLWKRQIWKAGRKMLLQQSLHQQQQQQQKTSNHNVGVEEAAIYSILADDFQNSLENPCIRSSWTRSLCVLLMGIHGKTQDEALHRHNLHRRRNGGCFPGYQYEKQENEQLMHTAPLASMTEAQMASLLENNPFLRKQEENQQQKFQQKTRRVSYKSAILAFVVGKSAILELCERETSRVVSELQEISERGPATDGSGDDEYVNHDWEGVRFLTHATLFLDSLQESSTPVICNGITTQKNAILFEYVQYLESRPDLWHMITLYVSLLPENKALEYFPTVLARVLDDSERKTMIRQIQELMPFLEFPLLRKVVRLSLSAPATAAGTDDMDAIKCNSLQWLLQKDEYSGDALICANILLRELFLDKEEDKTHAAEIFLKDFLPGDLLEKVRYFAENEDFEFNDGNSGNTMKKVSNAITEHLAFVSYLDAYEAFEKWKEILKETPTALENHHQIPNYVHLSEMEKNIADSNFLRTWVKEKKKHLEKTLSAAEEARKSWHNVLTHPGGWLLINDDDEVPSPSTTIAGVADGEEQKRRSDIRKIRSRHLVLATSLYHQVCEETASWLSRSLNEAENFHLSREEVLQRLQSSHTGSSSVGGNCAGLQQTPQYWFQHALDLATLVSSDQHGIYKAFPRADLQELITKIGETAVSKLMNA